jgi:hypothetical protein
MNRLQARLISNKRQSRIQHSSEIWVHVEELDQGQELQLGFLGF